LDFRVGFFMYMRTTHLVYFLGQKNAYLEDTAME